MLINYIPEFLRDFDEFIKLFSSLDIEISKLKSNVSELLSGQFIFYCNETFIDKFEKDLKIEVIDEDIEKRRKKLIIKFNEKLPYTVFRLKENLNIILGEDNYSLFLIYDKYRLILRVKTNDESDFSECISLLERMIPANIERNVQRFNTHEIVGNFKNEYLEKYTHEEIYSEII